MQFIVTIGSTSDALRWHRLQNTYLGYIASNGMMTDELERIWKGAVMA
jgi:hypothetical protein